MRSELVMLIGLFVLLTVRCAHAPQTASERACMDRVNTCMRLCGPDPGPPPSGPAEVQSDGCESNTESSCEQRCYEAC
jgi:hypothetical protein